VIVHQLPEGTLRYYSGQAIDVHYRITKNHCDNGYRSNNPSLNYWFWDASEDGFFLTPVLEKNLALPLMNLLEQWTAIVFRGLQPKELEMNLPAGAYETLSEEERETGAGLTEPLKQGISFSNWWVS